MVLGVHNQTISLVVVVISVFAYFRVKNNLNCHKDYYENQSGSSKLLLIAVTSAQENIEKRQSIRDTWIKLANNESLKYFFLIGERFCHIPRKYRLSHLSCEEWELKLDPNVTEETVFSTISENKGCKREDNDLATGFSFILNNDITVNQFGIASVFLGDCSVPIQVVLLDLITQKKILSSTFISNAGTSKEEIVWKRVQKTTLPSGFEGKFIIEGGCVSKNNKVKEEKNSRTFILSDNTNVIRFLQVFTNGNISSIYTNNICIKVGLSFSIKGVEKLHKLITDKNWEWSVWQNYIKDEREELNSEINTYKDILLLDVVDVYSNLPMKMLQFYKWFNVSNNYKNYEYVLKTDDDVFIDIPKIIKELEVKYNFKKQWSWWSCFRINWPVQKAGKWRELSLNLTIYPNFPSGAGYVLNNKVIKYINDNISYLFTESQGEDVSLGLWLKDLNPKMHIGSYCRWSCDNICWKDACNIMELNVTQMYTRWQQYLSCNNSFCWCK